MKFRLEIATGAAVQRASAVDEHDRAQLLMALEAAHARDHQLVLHIAKLEASLAEQNELLRTRTIERDHFAQDGHLWGLCLAYLVKDEGDTGLELPADAVNACEGLMLSGVVDGGVVRIVVAERPPASHEGGGEGG